MTLLEVTLALSALAFILGVATLYLHQQAGALTTVTRDSSLMHRAEVMLDSIGNDLRFARGDVPQGWLTFGLAAADSGFLELDSTLPFPDRGTLLLEPGTPEVERIGYGFLDPGNKRLGALIRGEQCTTAGSHPAGVPVLWAAAGTAIEDQTTLDPSFFDGISQELTGPVLYRGDGTGFCYRLPVDPSGGEDYFDDAGDVQWGVDVDGVVTLDGRACFYFSPVAVIQEAARGADLNGDGDQVDSFDLGQIMKRVWNSSLGSTSGFDVALCPPMILQEVCNWGSDLDGDASNDPIFLWEPKTSRLRIRLFLLDGSRNGTPVVRTSEVSYFLRNGADL